MLHPDLKALRDPVVSRLRRRLVTIPLLAVAWLTFTALFPVFLVVGAVGDVVRRGPAVLTRSVLFFTCFVWCEVLGVAAAFFIWLTLWWSEARFLDANNLLQRVWNRALLFGGGAIFGMRFDIEGAETLDAPGPLLVFPRHVSTVDAVIPVSLLRGFHFRFVLKRALLSDPCLDVVGNRLPNAFAERGTGNLAREVQRVTALLTDLSARDAIVVYPEGTRFTPSRRTRLIERASASDHARTVEIASMLRHTLPPLTSGTLALLRENRGADVLFIAHTGLEAAGGFPDFMRGGLVGARVKVKMWRVPFAEIPGDDDGRVTFLAREWQRIDDFVGAQQPVRSRSGAAPAADDQGSSRP